MRRRFLLHRPLGLRTSRSSFGPLIPFTRLSCMRSAIYFVCARYHSSLDGVFSSDSAPRALPAAITAALADRLDIFDITPMMLEREYDGSLLTKGCVQKQTSKARP